MHSYIIIVFVSINYILMPSLATMPFEQDIPTPETVWADFDPEKVPLEEEIIKEWTENGARHKEVYFSAFVNGEKVRIYAIYAVPDKAGKYPAVMHLHGGGQTVSKHWLKPWTNRGYAILTIDTHGKSPDREKYTIYPESLKQGNLNECGDLICAADPNLKVGSWYIWAAVNRWALNYLAEQPEVVSYRIGAFGISMGGMTIWNIAIDKRLKAICSIYGAGWNSPGFPPEFFARKFDTNYNRPEPALQQKKWISGMAPQSYAPYIRCPVLCLSASNDYWCNIDYVFDTIKRLPEGVPWRVAISPHYSHHIGKDEGEDLFLWMDTWLNNGPKWPETPTSVLTLNEEGFPLYKLKIDESHAVKKVRVYYNIGNFDNNTRYWSEIEPVKSGESSWYALLPTTGPDKYMVVFANVYYKSGICITSPLKADFPANLGSARANDISSLTIYDGSMGVKGWAAESVPTDPIPPIPVPVLLREGPDGKQGISPENTHRKLLTFKIGDPTWRGPDGASLRFKVFSASPQNILIRLTDKDRHEEAKSYSSLITLQGESDWQTITLPKNQFKAEKGVDSSLEWKDMRALRIMPGDEKMFKDENLIFTDFEWVMEKE